MHQADYALKVPCPRIEVGPKMDQRMQDTSECKRSTLGHLQKIAISKVYHYSKVLSRGSPNIQEVDWRTTRRPCAGLHVIITSFSHNAAGTEELTSTFGIRSTTVSIRSPGDITKFVKTTRLRRWSSRAGDRQKIVRRIRVKKLKDVAEWVADGESVISKRFNVVKSTTSGRRVWVG